MKFLKFFIVLIVNFNNLMFFRLFIHSFFQLFIHSFFQLFLVERGGGVRDTVVGF